MKYKFKIGDKFKKDNNIIKIIRFSKLDEFGADFYWDEKNYVVEIFDLCDNIIEDKVLATYNFHIDGKIKYVMNEDDLFKILQLACMV